MCGNKNLKPKYLKNIPGLSAIAVLFIESSIFNPRSIKKVAKAIYKDFD